MKKLLLILFISFGLIGSSYACDIICLDKKNQSPPFEIATFPNKKAVQLKENAEAKLAAEQAALEAFQQKLAADKAAAAASTAAYQDSLLEKIARDERLKNKRAELKLEKELAAFEAQLEAEFAPQEMMAEIEAELAAQEMMAEIEAEIEAEMARQAERERLLLETKVMSCIFPKIPVSEYIAEPVADEIKLETNKKTIEISEYPICLIKEI